MSSPQATLTSLPHEDSCSAHRLLSNAPAAIRSGGVGLCGGRLPACLPHSGQRSGVAVLPHHPRIRSPTQDESSQPIAGNAALTSMSGRRLVPPGMPFRKPRSRQLSAVVRPSRIAYFVSSATLSIPSLSMRFLRCVSTVLTLTFKCIATCFVALPSARS
jgi:hypothetical protein